MLVRLILSYQRVSPSAPNEEVPSVSDPGAFWDTIDQRETVAGEPDTSGVWG